jgi:acyl dehydratase
MSANFDMAGREIKTSAWHEVTQDRIDRFARATADHQFIHTDPRRAAAESPYRTTIAHGFLVLSLLSVMVKEVGLTDLEAAIGVNYGFDRIRFLSPVPCGSRVRGHFTLLEVTSRAEKQILRRFDVTVEIEHHSKPALVAEWLTLTISR